MESRVLGEIQLLAGGRLLDVGTARQQGVLAVLVVDTGRPVGIETLIDRAADRYLDPAVIRSSFPCPRSYPGQAPSSSPTARRR
jgi:hypothetical protein